MNSSNNDATKPLPAHKTRSKKKSGNKGGNRAGQSGHAPKDASQQSGAAAKNATPSPASTNTTTPIAAPRATDSTPKPPTAEAIGAAASGLAHGKAVTDRLAGSIKERISAFHTNNDNAGNTRSTSRTTRNSNTTSSGTSPTPPAPRTSTATSSTTSANPAPNGARRVRLTLARLDPWSVMKFSFLVAVAFGIATIIAVALLWNIVDSIGLWDQINELGKSFNSGEPVPFMEYFEFSKMISYATLVSFLNLIIITALGTLGAFLYNIVAALLGGIKITFTDN